jgi:hypothetical protein
MMGAETMRSALLLMSCGLMTGCKDKSANNTLPDDTEQLPFTIDTGDHVDTSDTETDTGDTGQTVDALESVALYPADLTVHTGATFSMRATGTWSDGALSELSPTWSSSDEKIATIDSDGIVTALSPGAVSLTAASGGQDASVPLTVSDDGLVHVSVISATSGEPVPDIKVRLGDEDLYYVTHADGTASVPVPTDAGGGPIEITAYGEAFVAATIWGTVSRTLTIPVHTDGEFWAANARLSGDVDFSSVDEGGLGDMTIGLVVPSFRYGPLLIEPGDLMAENRTVSVYGLKTDIPANLALRNHAEGYAASTPAEGGTGAAWVIAAAMPIGDITGALDEDTSDTEAALALLGEHVDALRWGWQGVQGIAAGETSSVNMAPSRKLSQRTRIQTGPLPGGFAGTEQPLVMVGEWLPEAGMLVTGLALGVEDVSVPTAPDGSVQGSDGTIAMSIAQVSGLGSGGAISSAWGPVIDDAATLPLFQNTPTVSGFDAVSHDFSMWTDPRSDYVRVILQSRDGTTRIVYLPGGEVAGVLSDPGFPMGYAVVIWRILSLETTADTFEGMVRRGDLVATSLAARSWTAAQASVTTATTGH